MNSEFFVLIITGMGILGGVIIVSISLLANAIRKRGASRKEVQEFREDIGEIRGSIEDIKEQLADIIIRLG